MTNEKVENLEEVMNEEVQTEETIEVINEDEIEVIENEDSNEDLQEKKIKNLENSLNQEKDKFLRYRAETENFKKRMREEADRTRKYSVQSIASNILPALDNFERALDVKEPSDELKNFLVGFEMIKNQLSEVLKGEGVEVIEALGKPFDPNFHQAVMQEAREGVESGIVLEELQKGYKLHDRVIRPTMVKVSE